ncbi:MAG: hypothetical protein ACP6IP_01860 [Candidatus Njordarchaeia archaeon]
MRIREIQGMLIALMNGYNTPKKEIDSKILRLIDDARETVVDILTEGASKQDILDAIFELLAVATILKIDVEKEINEFLEDKAYSVIN